jgi:hypothetical protein
MTMPRREPEPPTQSPRDWQALEPKRARNLEAAISIEECGQMHWSALIDAAIGKPKFVEILYDSKSSRSGIRAAMNARACGFTSDARGSGPRAH